MSRYCVSADQLFSRTWRAGHPFSPRCGRFRRVGMLLLLLGFGLVILGYSYVTDSRRVRGMAEKYLSQVMG
ncbi:MAG: hypothetical protein JWP03_3041, partial [Phycisphaerales bacterium]|nr:hypothetical protein [Phycisphaerales bacterium]